MTDTQITAAVQRIYDTDPAREWAREERHRTEFALTRRALVQYLPPPPARVLDCGGGPGRYAIGLAQQGYNVTLFDLSPGNLVFAREKAAVAGVTLTIAEGNALDLSRYPDASFDAVLLMGPLYHLLEAAERELALAEAHRVLAPGGVLFAAFIARYAAHRDAAAKYPIEPVERPGLYERIEVTGLLPPLPDNIFVAYFARPEEVGPLCWQAGFEVTAILGVEGLVSIIETIAVNGLSGPAWEWWLDANWRAAADPSIHGAVEHLLAVAHKPRWRTVLAKIARCLDEAGVFFQVVGGASLALHGLPLPVKDLDLQTDTVGAYRFQDLFAERAVQPVTYSECSTYRSHFGRFDFDGVTVDVMAELEWREGDRWLPINAKTEMTVEVEGASVRVPWAEEELLAYIRRGRLERAAQILPHLNRDRLLALLRKEIKPGTI